MAETKADGAGGRQPKAEAKDILRVIDDINSVAFNKIHDGDGEGVELATARNIISEIEYNYTISGFIKRMDTLEEDGLAISILVGNGGSKIWFVTPEGREYIQEGAT
jgi:hypothetical protein